MKLLSIYAIVVLLAGFAGGCSTTQLSEELLPMSICDLDRLGAAADGTRVRIQAIYTTDGQERSLVTDEECPAVKVDPYWATERRDEKSIALLDKAVWLPVDDHSLRVFRYEVSGVFKWRKAEAKRSAIYVEKVWSFQRIDPGHSEN